MVFIDQSDPKRRRRLPDKKIASKALGYVDKLLRVDLGYLKLQSSTRRELETLERQLAETASVRKMSENRTYAQRRFVGVLVWYFLRDFDQTLYTVMQELNGLIDYSVSSPALHAQVQEIRRRHTARRK
jgi:hypothetical protein